MSGESRNTQTDAQKVSCRYNMLLTATITSYEAATDSLHNNKQQVGEIYFTKLLCK